MFPGYELTEQLHTGVSSNVLRARRETDGERVVLKAFKPVFPDANQIARFEREYEIQARLELEGVPRVGAFLTHQGQHVLEMADSGGRSLRQILAREDLTLAERVALCVRIVEIVEQLHAARVIHKNINPANIIWNRKHDRVEVIDFGTATLVSREEALLRPGTALEGTLAYMSPEQTGRVNALLDYRADYYALGATFYELFTGAPPFVSEDPVTLVHSHIARTPTPPHERNANIPTSLSELIMKLLEKSADRRYQSSLGLRADLQRIHAALQRGEPCPSFPLAREDVSAKLILPQRLYGRGKVREELLAILNASVEPTRRSASFVLVAGPSGIGKSSLVYDLVEPITASHGHFVAGKYEQFGRNTPYSAVVRAFRDLVREVLTSGDEALSRWTTALSQAFGQSGRLITDVIPEVELLIGPQPEVQPVEPNEARNRFNLMLHRFIGVFAQPEHPLVLFLDDLQWADRASLALIEELVSSDRTPRMLLLGAYRDNEVDAQHPLRGMLDRLAAADARVETLVLEPLSPTQVTRFVADALGDAPERVGSLAALVHRSTDGNPLFVSELLKFLSDHDLVRPDGKGGWRWDLAEVEAKGATENILELMVAKIRQLPADTQTTLQLAACVGSSFGLQLLAALLERSAAEVFESLLPAIDSGVLLMSSEFAPVDAAGISDRRARFFHDRIQQGAYALVGEDERPQVHTRIGRLLLETMAEDQRGKQVFDIVDQLNRGRALLETADQRFELAGLNLEAGLRARSSAAFDAAADYLRLGRELLPENAWASHYALSLELYTELALVEFFVGNLEASDRWTKEILGHARTESEKAEAYNIMARCYTMIGRYPDSLAAVRSGLALLEVPLPSEDTSAEDMGAVISRAAERVQTELGDTKPLALLNRPTMTERRAVLASELVLGGVSSAFYVDRGLYCVLILRFVSLTLEHGHPPRGFSVYGFYAHLLATMFGQPKLGDDFGHLALELSARQMSPRDTCSTAFMMANYVHHWCGPMAEIRRINRAGFEAGLESGELQFAGYILTYEALCDLFCGRPLAGILDDLLEHLVFSRRTNNTMASDAVLAYMVAISNLSGATDGPEDFRVGELSETQMLAEAQERGSVIGAAIYPVLKTMNCVIHRLPEASLAAAKQAEELQAIVSGAYATAQVPFRSALAHSLALDALDVLGAGPERDAGRAEHLAAIDAAVEQLGTWAEGCGENFAHMYALVEAEALRARGEVTAALAAYARAVVLADEHDYPHDAALAEEQLGRLWLARGKLEVGRGYLKQAFGRYRSWGAKHKLAQLEDEFEWLGEKRTVIDRTVEVTLIDDLSQPRSGLDLASVIKASQAISGELVAKRLAQRLMGVVLENAGAQSGALILREGTALQVVVVAQASGRSAAFEIDAERSVALDDYTELPHSVIQFAARTGESVLLNERPDSGRFASDPYFEHHQPKSVLCLPLVQQGASLGFLYLENSLVTGAFTARRLELLHLLASQFVISFENARLYDDLEHRVERRTQQLAAKNEELETTLANLAATQTQLIHSEKMASLGELTAGVAHEINNPLNFVNNFAEMGVQLIDEFEELDGQVSDEASEFLHDLKTNVALILKHGRRASGIVASMLRHARGTVGQREPTDLNSLVRDYVALADFGAESPATVELELGDNVGNLEIIPQEIARVLVNLLNNAHHAVRERAREEDPSYDGRISITTSRVETGVEIIVRDNGSGIPKDICDRIFEPFFTTKPGTDGTGLGLSVCYDIVVEGHGGSIDVESEPGVRTAFTIRLD